MKINVISFIVHLANIRILLKSNIDLINEIQQKKKNTFLFLLYDMQILLN